MPFKETVPYGQHEHSDFAEKQAEVTKERKKRILEQIRKNEDSGLVKTRSRMFAEKWMKVSETNFGRNLEDFIFLTSLAIAVSIFSFVIDIVINRLISGRLYLLDLLSFSVVAQYCGWTSFTIILTCFSVGFTHFVAPTAAGSGIPEVKTMVRGVALKEYLTFRTLVAKIVGLMGSLGSGLPVGKEGPFVHIAGATASVIADKLPSFRRGFERGQKSMAEILAPASALGVACTFASTVGGLLFSIETTATFFAVRNYWRSFYAAAFGTIFFRCLNTWINEEESLHALEKTYLRNDIPFALREMFAYALLGIACGLAGYLFITMHKHIVLTVRFRKTITGFLQKNRFIYPTIVSCIVASIMFPPGFGNYHAGEMTNPEALEQLFTNFTFTGHEPRDLFEQQLMHHWGGPTHNAILTCALFFCVRMFTCAISTTVPFPCGLIVPAFTIGAGFGRMFGEIMAHVFPRGLNGHLIVPGGYALVGSAAVAGAVTHTFSPVVIIFELTGQLDYLLPCLVAVIIANLVSRLLTPSVYDVTIAIKKLPFLPVQILPSNESESQLVLAEDIMLKDVKFLTYNSTYQEAQALLSNNPYKTFPIVNSADDMLLLGTIQRRELHRALDEALCLENKLAYFSRKLGISSTLEPINSCSGNQQISQQEEYLVQCGKGRKPSVSNVDVGRKFSTVSTGSAIVAQFSANQRKISTVSRTSRLISTASFHPQMNEILKTFTEEERKKYRLCSKSSHQSLDSYDPQQDIEWRNHELCRTIDFDACQVNVAPFQIVDKMSLWQIHSLFSILGLHDTLVTNAGCLVGVISLQEVRKAVQGEITVTSHIPSARQQCMSWLSCIKSSESTPNVNETLEMGTFEKKSLNRKSN